MVTTPQPQQDGEQKKQPVPIQASSIQAGTWPPESLHKLQEMLWDGAALNTILWNYRTGDWVTCVQATDIDNDGDIEIIIGSRNGTVVALTPWGAKKWEKSWENQSVSALFAIPLIDIPLQSRLSHKKSWPKQACVVVGMRNGNVYALSQDGSLMPDWSYTTGRMIRQIHVNDKIPTHIIIGSEDRCIHILDRATGKPLVEPYHTKGWIRSVYSCDIDGDHKEEILAGAGDNCLYIFDEQGRFEAMVSLGHQIYALFAASLKSGDTMNIVTSSNRKDLFVWTLQRHENGSWSAKKEWEKSPQHALFNNRIHSIYVIKMNKDSEPKILLGSEDGYLYILDQHGSLVWKRRFGSCIYSVWAADINFDGQTEIIVGTEDSGVYAVQVELSNNLYKRIEEVYKEVIPNEQVASKMELMKKLSPREKVVVKDFFGGMTLVRHDHLELKKAINYMKEEQYEEAISLLLSLRQQRVQYCWSQPVLTRGYIWTLDFGHIENSTKRDIVIGTDEGMIYAVDVEQGADKIIWQKDVQDRVRMLCCVSTQPDESDTILALLANHRFIILNHQGTIIKEHTFEWQDWARCICVARSAEQTSGEAEILIGLENNKIAIWNTTLEKELAEIATPQGINFIYYHALTKDGEPRIVSGSINNQVYAHDRQGKLLWSYTTLDRIRSVFVKDIDRDGFAEIIVGSDDRYVYVLDYQGHLKWRYRIQRSVSDVSVCDIRAINDPEDAELRDLKVLVSSADGNLYILTAQGDLLWKYPKQNRIRDASAEDINNDGWIEIIMTSENQLDLLQVLDPVELENHIERCWEQWVLSENENNHTTIMQLTNHKDEYIRAFALAKLAGLNQRQEKDFQRFQEALRNDDALEIKRELVQSIVVLCQVPHNHEENTRLARLFLSHLSSDPDPEIRLAIVKNLPELLQIEQVLCFEYLEHFTHNVDMWVRHAVVRQLAQLTENYPDQAFQLLVQSINDDEEWIRQETGRALAGYFDDHPKQAIQDGLILVAIRTNVEVLQQISYSATTPEIRHWFRRLAKLLSDLDESTIDQLLSKTVQTIQELLVFDPLYGEAIFETYNEFQQALQAHTIKDLARYHWTDIASEENPDDPAAETIKLSVKVFERLKEVTETLRSYERREAIGDRVTSLITAIDIVDAIRLELQQEEIRQKQSFSNGYSLPELVILFILINKYHKIIKAEMSLLRGTARLIAEVRNKEIRREDEIAVSLSIRNKGISAADNVHISLHDGPDFTVIGTTNYTLTQLTTNNPATITFMIRPLSDNPRLSFHIIYDDAEKRGKQEDFADIITLSNQQHPYHKIPNPYTSGTPIRERKMFYGRIEDIEVLREKINSEASNKVVVLSGQRRMGKTSLIYQLADELSKEPYIPVLIDLQGQPLQNNMGQLFEGFALRIQETIQKYKKCTVPIPNSEAFQSNTTATFDSFLSTVFQNVPGEKLILLLDEFEVLQEKIDKGPLNKDVLNYLRSLMQHRQGLNFLLVGAPKIRYLTEPYWSVFFNIALHHRVQKLKPGDAEALITDPVQSALEYDQIAMERVRNLAGDQPYFIHVISEALIAHCNKNKRSYVTINDVNSVLDTILEEQAGCVNWIWNQSSEPQQHILLSILAQERGDEGRIFSLSDISAEFDIQGINYEQEKVLLALQNLVREDIVEERFNGTQFRIPIGLVKEWLRKSKPPERVIREEHVYGE